MKYLKVYSLSLFCFAIAGCGGLGKMEKNASTVKYEVTPNPLELHGDSVAITVKGSYPAKYFSKKANLSVTPVIKTASGDRPFGAAEVKGEKATAAPGSTINYKAGGGFTYTGKIPYTPEMRAGEVMVNVKGTQGKKTKDFAQIKIADATITTPLLAQSQGAAIMAKDNYVRTINKSYNGQIYYAINTSNVNSNFKHKQSGIVNKNATTGLDSIMKSIKNENFMLKGIDVTGNASPDGALDLNTKLADARSKSASKYVEASMKKGKGKGKDKNMTEEPAPAVNLSTNSEDWPGFQKLMQESDMEQRDMILRIVSSNADTDAREMEIKKMGKAYTEIADEILPKLRKSDIVYNAQKEGRSDEQISATAKSNPDSLTIEELLRAGSLAADNEKGAIYANAERMYPEDWRAANNAGVVKYRMKDVDGAMADFTKADKLAANNTTVKNNMGAVYLAKGDRKMATEMLNAAQGAGDEVNWNMATIDILNGNYSAAVSHCGSANTFNCALAKLLSGDKTGAMTTLQASDDKDTAMGHYLAAVIGARNGNGGEVTSHLTTAVQKDPSLKAMAKDDREFIKWYNDAGFKAIVQ
jgi:tetratricopeptide (TPR) repeat protein